MGHCLCAYARYGKKWSHVSQSEEKVELGVDTSMGPCLCVCQLWKKVEYVTRSGEKVELTWWWFWGIGAVGKRCR